MIILRIHYNGPLMKTDEHGYLDALTERVLGAVFDVSNTLGAGFLEKVYQRALLHELRKAWESTLPAFSWKTCWSSS